MRRLIDGVRVKQLKVIPDERGRLMEILRVDDELFEKFGQVYLTTVYAGVVKAWHAHKLQDDNIAAVHGMAKLVLCDLREKSPTHKMVNEFVIGVHNPVLVHIPKLVHHGFTCVDGPECLLINAPTMPYNAAAPDELRLPFDTKEIPYSWERRNF